MTTLLSELFQKEETFLDVPFTGEEISRLLQKRMKLKKSAGPDDLTSEHRLYRGHTIVTWITELLNSI